MLCDVSKIHTGFGVMPKVTHTTDDADWGKSGSSKKIFVEKSFFQKGGFAFSDNVLERKENQCWKIQVDNFQSWTLGFYKFVGEWKTTLLEPHKTMVEYTYYLHANIPLFYPLNWLFTKIFFTIYMKRVLENVRNLTYHQEPYLYD
jgi:hypothetical protein